MNYKTTLVVTAMAVAAIAALGSAFPMVGNAFAQFSIGGFEANSCSGDVGNNNDCRQQGFQGGRDNTQDNTIIDATIDINLQ